MCQSLCVCVWARVWPCAAAAIDWAGAVNRSVWSACGDKGVSISGHSSCQVGVQRRFGQNRDAGPLLASSSHLSSSAGCFMIVFLTLLELTKVESKKKTDGYHLLTGVRRARSGFARDKQSTERALTPNHYLRSRVRWGIWTRVTLITPLHANMEAN